MNTTADGVLLDYSSYEDIHFTLWLTYSCVGGTDDSVIDYPDSSEEDPGKSKSPSYCQFKII